MTTPQPTDEFVFGNCIKCQGLVRVPVTTRASAQVRCPRCNESFELSEILEQEIPALEVVSDPASSSAPSSIQINTDRTGNAGDHQPVPKTEDGRFVIPPQLAREATRRKRRGSSSSIEGRGETAKTSRAKSSKSSKSGRRNHAFKTRRAPSRNPVLDVVLVIAGGCMSVPVAQLLIWWFLGSDPLGLAPHTARFAPFLVPAELRSAEPDPSGQEPTQSTAVSEPWPSPWPILSASENGAKIQDLG